MPRRYRIYLLSAKSILSYAKEEGGAVTIALNRDATRRCVVSGRQEQEENALFFQIQCAFHGDGFIPTEEPGVVEDLSAVLCYVDFSGIFDRSPASPRVARLQTLAETLFRPEGVTLDLGDGPRQYAAFERSNSMSRQGRLSFLRADLWETVRRRIMLDLELGQCQLSKLYAYNGLMLSSGTRVEGIEIDRPHRVIVVDNHALQRSARVITVEDVGGTDSVRRYRRVERVEDFSVTEFDGEGLISKEYAARLNKALGGRHTSFQMRLPFVKGMLHQVDFHDFFRSAGTTHLTDLWGVNHPVAKVDVILTKSMFKGYGWLAENGKSWEDYWAAFRKYRHALYVTNVSKERPQGFTQLNYQFLTTLSMTGEEFRPRDLPDGWEHSPKGGRPPVADESHGDRILQAAGGRSLPPPGVHPAGRLAGRRPQKPGLPSGKTAGEEPGFHRRVGVPGAAGGHGPAALKRLRPGQAAGGRGRPVPLRGLAAVSGHADGCDPQKAHQVPVDLPVRRTIHRVSRPRLLRAPSRV